MHNTCKQRASLGRWVTIGCAVLAVCLTCNSSTAADPMKFDRLFPAAVAAGSANVIATEGKFPTWPVVVICDRSDATITCASESGKLNIEVAVGATPGVAWIRLADSQGVSDLRPLLITRSTVSVEQEPNGSLGEAPVIALPATLTGRLEKSEDVDGFQVSLAEGETLYARVIAKQILNSDMDAVLQIANLKGNVLAQSDDEVGIDPQLVYVAQQAQACVVRLFAFPETPNSTIGFSGSASYVYALQLSKTPVADHFLPLLTTEDCSPRAYGWQLADAAPQVLPPTQLSPNVAYLPEGSSWQWLPKLKTYGTSTCQSIFDDQEATSQLPALFSGHISTRHEVDRFRFHASADTKMRARVHSRQFGFPLDSVLTIVDLADNRELARNDDGQRNDYDASLDFSVKAETQLELRISDLADSFGPRHAYSIHVYEIAPSVALASDKDHLEVKPGETTELSVSVTRQDGFDRELSIQAVELPEGLTCEATVSQANGDSSKSVQLKISASATAATGHYPFRIAATEQNVPQPNIWPVQFSLRPEIELERFWLSIPK